MFKRALLSTLSLAVGITLTTGGVAAATQTHTNTIFYAAVLTGANEVPAADPADQASAIVSVTGTTVCFAERWSHLTTPTASHIHAGRPGAPGPVKIPFFAGQLPASITALTGCTTSDAATLDAIAADPAAFYVNIHTPLFPAGAARGQLTRLHHAVDLQQFLGHPNFAALARGANEVPNPGAPNGLIIGLFDIGASTVGFAMHWQGFVSPVAAHIHKAPAGTAGPVVVPFFAAPAGLPATLTGVAGSVTADPALLTQIRQNPSGYYFNMHTAAFPAGVARGQLVIVI
ncbi:CHRD domain-containing protein [Kutzneria chonburiensis]|uniref:CHRD domain-containing protein n=1 Tax=Kutzneria chonburiensis TaxID=1483604 RepID=A0ABV6N8N8_9PSEU|nr:CHRD domain-containing protein [Kutzneria chonburiensis]